MQSNIIGKVLSTWQPATTKLTATGQTFQARNHVKMYPWRTVRTKAECYLDPDRTPYTDKYNMNEFKYAKKLKSWQKVICKDKDNRFNAYKWNDAYKSDPREAKETAQSKLERFSQSLRVRGSARERKAYSPPDDVEEKILGICKSIGIPAGQRLNDRELKFRFISGCIDIFQHDMPNSYLNDVNTIQDVIEYFSTAVIGVNPYDNLIRKANELPPNLAILAEPARFNKDTDTFFKGYTAYPGMVTKVAGLRGSKRYPTLNQDEFQWPDI